MRVLFVLVVATMFGCASRDEPKHEEYELGQTSFSFDADRSFEMFNRYDIKPGDVLDVLYHVDPNAVQDDFILRINHKIEVKFPSAPLLSETQTIRPDGTISLPYLGVTAIAGKTVRELTDALRASYTRLADDSLVREHHIGVDSVVSVKFVKLPELNESQAVRSDGTISLPYLGVVLVAGKTVAAFSEELKTAYQAILEKPDVYVIVARPQREPAADYLRGGRVTDVYVVVHEFNASIDEFKKDLHTAPRGLSRLVTVRPDGHATFALVGDLFVAGKTIPEVDTVLDAKYRAALDGLTVDLFLERHGGSQIYVLGAVKTAGPYPVVRPTSILHVLAMAGSVTPEADLTALTIVRRHHGKMIATRLNIDQLFEKDSKTELFYLQPDDIVYVPRRGLSQAAVVAREIADVIFFRGWGVSLTPIR